MLFFLLVLSVLVGHAQKTDAPRYMDSIKAFRAGYIQTHELLTTAEQKALLRFYPLAAAYRVIARFEKYADSPWFPMATSGRAPKIQRKYGRLTFTPEENIPFLTGAKARESVAFTLTFFSI
jgi:hypothetical protein